MSTPPAEHRYRFDPLYPGTRVKLPAGSHWVVSVFLLFWIVPWGFGERFALNALLADGEPIYVKLFLAVWLTGWTAGGLLVIGAAFLPWFGVEELRVDVGAGEVQLYQGLGRIGRTRRWPLHQVEGLEYVMPDPDSWNEAEPTRGGLQLLASGKTARFGWGLKPAEARALLHELQLRHSTFKPRGQA